MKPYIPNHSLTPRSKRLFMISVFIVLIANSGWTQIPEALKNKTELTSYAELTQIVQDLDSDSRFSVSEAGKSGEGRSLWLIRISDPKQTVKWRVFFYAQQHGNEPAGKEALIYLARAIQKNPKLLGRGVELWLMPMVNPDGAERDQRRNAVDADLNRDHMILEQPETQALHKTIRSIQPHLSIDCHEFARDSDDYREKGWIEWTEIMMDYANYPLLDDALVLEGADLVNRVGKAMVRQGVHFQRYFVGGVPPDGEQRYSAPDMDGGLNAAAIYGGLSFIIEGGVYRNDNADNHDLPMRIHNYTQLLFEVLKDKKIRRQALPLLESKNAPELPNWVPNNYFWAKSSESIISIPVLDAKTKQTIQTPAPNFMVDLVIKKSVSRPQAYIIPPEHADVFSQLLQRHALPFQVLQQAATYQVQYCLLDTVEMEFDELYHRYGGRVISSAQPVESQIVEAGSLIVPVDIENGLRTMAILEPTQMFGLCQYPTYEILISKDRKLPVARVLN